MTVSLTKRSMNDNDRRAIEADVTRLIYTYTWANDAQDWQACANMFTWDAIFRRPSGGDALKGREAILEAFLSRKARVQRHAIANILVDVRSPERVRAKSVIVLYMGDEADDGGLPVQAANSPLIGTYEDLCVLGDGQWRFAERIGSLDFRP